MPAKKKIKRNKASARWIGQPVLVIMKDGSYYVGTMSGIDRHGVKLSELRTDRGIPNSIVRGGNKAQVSGLLSLLLGGSARGASRQRAVGGSIRNGSNGRGMFGLFGQMIPHIRLGMNMVRTIMPLMGIFK
ncbi:hypothetical protein GRF59_04545 [Paenibacillus sp. HJL G12]|uniref:Uncharacterized protein n=2 Tax=Paenibacillus dendrobii TaxID=2691084 RepID=A0A7X3LH69_9BACL|nr:hypothetical protein [Paenibacillus dendrobii]